MSAVKVSVEIDPNTIESKIDELTDDQTMLAIHNLLIKMNDPYVPMKEGFLSQSAIATPEYAQYQGPYAHYQYMGLVYGPNIPILQDGVIVGWFSPPGQSKQPTGDKLKYSKEQHPLATDHWDKAMMADKGEEFIEQVHEILRKRGKQNG